MFTSKDKDIFNEVVDLGEPITISINILIKSIMEYDKNENSQIIVSQEKYKEYWLPFIFNHTEEFQSYTYAEKYNGGDSRYIYSSHLPLESNNNLELLLRFLNGINCVEHQRFAEAITKSIGHRVVIFDFIGDVYEDEY